MIKIILWTFILGTLFIRPDPLIQNQKQIFDENGKQEGTIKPDPLFEGRYRIYDENGGLKGEIRPDVLFPDRQIFKEYKTK